MNTEARPPPQPASSQRVAVIETVRWTQGFPLGLLHPLLALWVPPSCPLLPLWKVTLQGDCGRSSGLCLRPRPAAGSVSASLLQGTGLFHPGQTSLLSDRDT